MKVLEFKTEYKANGDGVDWVHYTSDDAVDATGRVMHSTWARVSHLRPPENDVADDDGGLKMAALRSQWNQIEPAYIAWQQNNEIPDHGTPLGAWPGVSSSQSDVLRRIGLTTVEAVAGASEGIMARPPLPNMRELKRQASLWLEGRSRADLEARMAELEAQNAAMAELLSEKEEKRGPGRPRKEPEAA